MNSQTEFSSLASLQFLPFIDANGYIPTDLQGKIGVYAIFNSEQVLQFIGYSRDIYLSLKQHLVRQPQQCYWLKSYTVERPNRTLLENIRDAWIAENGTIPVGNSTEQAKWNEPIDTKPVMTDEEQEKYTKSDELTQSKLLKIVARRVEEQILSELKSRGVQEEIRFNPKLKESGLLDLK